MDASFTPMSTGIPGLDTVIQSVMPGDNFVWQIDSIDQYAPFARALAADALKNRRKLVYFRFAAHEPLLEPQEGLAIHEIDLTRGFESATTEMHTVIEEAGRGAYFVFDCLSDLTTHWYSDMMLGNFFMLTCPFVYYLDSVAYFAIIRNRHTLQAVGTIRDTTQIIIDVSTFEDRLSIQPLKVWQRTTPTMYLPHLQEGDAFVPVTDSATISRIVTSVKGPAMRSSRILDLWERTFLAAQRTVERLDTGDADESEARPLFNKLARMLFSRDEDRAALLAGQMTLADIMSARERLIGTGLVGEKTLGMLLGQAMLKAADPRWISLLEPADAFYIGSDVFYTYIVTNSNWWVRKKQRCAETYLDDVFVARQNMLRGEMPTFIIEPFEEMLDYFGQSPIVVRSSSLMEDSLGSGCAGVYTSVFCVNQGSRSERLEDFIDAVKQVYASTMSKEALEVRARNGMLDCDEQMAVLVQRVSGMVDDSRYYPHLTGTAVAGAGGDGIITLTIGLGAEPAGYRITFDEKTFTLESKAGGQKQATVLDLRGNAPETVATSDLPVLPVSIPSLTENDGAGLLRDLREMLGILADGFGGPVATEFTVLFDEQGGYRINLLRCRAAGE